DRRTDEPRRFKIDDNQQQHIHGPDAQHSPPIEVAEVMRPLARFEQDARNEETGEHEKEIYSGPSPQRGHIHPCAFESRVTVIEDNRKHGNPAQPLQLGNVGWQPGWSSDGQDQAIVLAIVAIIALNSSSTIAPGKIQTIKIMPRLRGSLS